MAKPLAVQDDHDAFGEAVRLGLSQTQKTIPARYFYDRAGSDLFERITDLPEYYPTRTEIGIFQADAGDIAATVGPGRAVVEFGSGSSTKTPLLLRAVQPAAYVPVDISAEFLQVSAAALAADFPGLPVLPVAADFTARFRLPAEVAALPKLGFFPGSTIGNMAPAAAVDLLRHFAAVLGPDSWLVIGMDLAKDVAVLEAAYDDAQGVTAAFNLNLLHRINRELGGTIETQAFRHRARWNPDASRIEMHLESTRDQTFTAAGQRFSMTAGETIHTENSHKWSLSDARLLAQASQWRPVAQWTDPNSWFTVQAWHQAAGVVEP